MVAEQGKDNQSFVNDGPRNSLLAIWSLVFGIFGLVCNGCIFGPIAIILGYGARKDILASNGRLIGYGTATAGLTLGIASFAINAILAIILMIYLKPMAGVIKAVASTKTEMKRVASALEAYKVENNAYPPSSLKALSANQAAITVSTFAPNALTTPISYLNPIACDRFMVSIPDAPFSYYLDNKKGWIIWSAGPDHKYNITVEGISANDGSSWQSDDISSYLLLKTYDATNGTRSSGDIWMTRETYR